MTSNSQADPLIGRLVDGRYRVRARIARGGMATVYVATDLRLERRIALKVMHSHLSDDSVFKNRFIQEARAAARLADPHVVNVFDQGQDGELAYLVMEYLPGITLRELLREQRRLTVAQTITIMDAILSGLAAAHKAGIVHRDVKPENVLLAEDGRIKIGDFGLARATTANTATGQQLLGTIAYLAPELVTRGTADARSDIYSLGIMLYEMLVGDQPYKGEQPMQIAFQHATESVPRPSVRVPSVPEPLDELVLWSTEKSPDERPLDAQQMLDRLREIERSIGVTPVVAAAPQGVVADPIEPTKVLPGTMVIPSAPETPASTPVDNGTLLRRRTAHRRARGAFLLTIVLLLAVLAGGTGWYFGSGPGSLITVPDVAGNSYEEAAGVLIEEGFSPARQDEASTTVDAGTTIRTDPSPGEKIDKESPVTVIVSSGPAPHDIEALAGWAKDDARGVLATANVTVTDDVMSFSDAAEDTVLSVQITPRADPGAPFDCTNGCTLHEDDTATITVSFGLVPDVKGLTVSQATDALAAKNLAVADQHIEDYHDSIEEGAVIGIAAKDDGTDWVPGDTVTLITSLGPELFAVPDVTGLTRDEAAQTLSDAGFTPEWNAIWSAFPNSFTSVTGTDPSAGSMRRSGTKVTIQIRSAAL